MTSSRRTFLIGTGASAAAAALVTPGSAVADNVVGGRPDPEARRFTLAVIPDTQYLFDADRGDSAPLKATLQYLLDHQRSENIVFTSHLGDLVENARKSEIDDISERFEVLDRRRVGYSVLAGNHDVPDSRVDDQRGRTPYLDRFGPQRFRHSPTFRGASADGYNTCHVFRAAGKDWLVLALDWRMSARGFEWARSVLKQHPKLPVILTTHELAQDGGDGTAVMSGYGRRLWDELIKDNDQVFLTLNGHFWPPARATMRNTAGNDVHVHITNYQDRYYGGGAMIRLYHFDLDRNTIDVRTLSPWLLGKRALNPLERREIELTGPADRFSVPIDFEQRFARFDPPVLPAPQPARDVLVRGTVAYWRLGEGLEDLSGNGNDLRQTGLLTASDDHHRFAPSHRSLFFDKNGYLSTVDSAPINRQTFERGYTVELFLKLPAGFDHPWCGLFTKLSPGSAAGKTGDDPGEPIATLNVAGGGQLQWAVFPRNQPGTSTNWGHEMDYETWWHIAVVNDGVHTTLYVDGSPLLRNPSTPARGISAIGDPWLVGAYAYNGVVEKSLHGWLGDLRVVNRPLDRSELMRSKAARTAGTD
ncbi:LamG-like jellyroll fold domain-containing protein [Nocardia sp. NRRL S-836]|uniref:LamG-like jellyroll fold domain-containing protein n=1 Tax=Nocardia sp. NRRL S-836 TaxID=1519492 RepID=UPI0006B032A0|nr:LamG-like jellyroll fold domain-containing protein [Nocardia sp. NRRL S-836]KOV78555.1 Tat pathway signal sequence domain protein [Nocardia sp. NRRL S-836]